MNIDLSKPWKDIFAQVAEVKAEEKRKKHEEELLEELDRQDTEKRVAEHKREKRDEEEKAFEQMLASTERLAAFSSRLDDLDTASVHALMLNGEALDRVQVQLDAMLEKAEKLPDGRRVFKTEDGTRVFDEHGAELPPTIIDPHSINDISPRWEPFKAQQDRKSGLEAERHDILEYQNKLDQARARSDKGGVTNKELDALDADLKSTMPPAVRDNLEHRGADADVPGVNVPGATAANLQLDRLRPAAPTGPNPN